ncbi:MAG: AAA family ATPase [Eubacteriales bacterium]|jgi:cytidylate kinase
MSKDIIVTVGRQYGSGGRRIGRRVADKLGIPFYDRELIAMAAKESGLREELLASFDEKAANSFLYSVVMGMGAASRAGVMGEMPLNDRLFLIQSDVIREIASRGPCVLVGRCSDYVLKDCADTVDVFVHADLGQRMEFVVREYGVEAGQAESIINKTDKKRSSYYNYYTGSKWGMAENYDLCIDSGIGLENCAEIIATLARLRSEE